MYLCFWKMVLRKCILFKLMYFDPKSIVFITYSLNVVKEFYFQEENFVPILCVLLIFSYLIIIEIHYISSL